jgi:hypothetical protein
VVGSARSVTIAPTTRHAAATPDRRLVARRLIGSLTGGRVRQAPSHFSPCLSVCSPRSRRQGLSYSAVIRVSSSRYEIRRPKNQT